jgi:cytochrome c biogenesis protein CcdA
VDSFLGNEPLADSINHLLVVGFYLVNIGFVTLALKYGAKATDAQTALEILSTKVGLVLVVLGAMHFFNLLVFSKMRRHALRTKQTLPVLPPGFHPAT